MAHKKKAHMKSKPAMGEKSMGNSMGKTMGNSMGKDNKMPPSKKSCK